MPIQLTSIAYIHAGQLVEVRAHAGFKSAEDVQEYLSYLELAEVGDRVEFWPIALYADIGDVPEGHTPSKHVLAAEGWQQV